MFLRFFCIIACLCIAGAFSVSMAQNETQYIKVKHIIIEGNKKTKPQIILREMTFRENDSFPAKNMDSLLLQNRINIFNLKLFTQVNVNIKNWDEEGLDLVIKVKESWYIIPLPIIAFADRNVTEWWKQYNHDFKRLQYGAQVAWNNISGRNDMLNVAMSFGFAQKLELMYRVPQFSRRKETVGISLYMDLFRSKKIAYNTVSDKLAFMDLGKSYQLKKLDFQATISYRKKIHESHFFTIGFGFLGISDSVRRANSEYFLDSQLTQRYVKVGYEFVADHRNLRAFPTDGWMFRYYFENYGLGFQKPRMTYMGFQFSQYKQWQRFSRFSVAGMVKFQTSWPLKQPYNLQPVKSLGYNSNIIRGYEDYVLNGQHYLLFKNEYRFRVFNFTANKFSKLRIKNKAVINSSLAYLPFNVFLTAYFDAGYVWDRYFVDKNNLTNKWQFGYGIGLNFVTLNNSILRIEYSLNRYLDKGVYLHFDLAL